MRKIVLALVVSLFSVQLANARAILTNEECSKVYRESAFQLLELVEDYNDGYRSRRDFAASVVALSGTTNTHRIACRIFENPNITSCVSRYKALYQAQRDQIHVRAVVVGNQDYVPVVSGLKARLYLADGLCAI